MTESIDFSTHPWFSSWTDPGSGVTSHVLTERVAPFQRSMYHTIRGTSDDGDYLWFTAIFPPSDHFCLAAARLAGDQPEIKYFPHCPLMPIGNNPLVAPDGRSATVVIGNALYRQPFDGDPTLLHRIDNVAPGHLYRLCTHMSQSCDGKYYVLDTHIGNAFRIVLVDAQTGEHRLLKRFYHNHHHTLFSPDDPELLLVGQGPWEDPTTGERGDEDLRAWIMNVDNTRYDALMPDIYHHGPRMALHEFWQADGWVGWCNFTDGVFEANMHEPPTERTRIHVWPRGCVHAHGDRTRRYYCCDTNPYAWSPDVPCGVYFLNRETGRDVAIAAALPYPTVIPLCEKRKYHFDPHPSFTADGAHIMYTTTVFGRLDIAFVSIDALVRATGGAPQ
jgi:hypothetical protein